MKNIKPKEELGIVATILNKLHLRYHTENAVMTLQVQYQLTIIKKILSS